MVARRFSSASAWRGGDSPEPDWPEQWPSRSERWPSTTPSAWVPEHPGRAITACVRRRTQNGVTALDTIEWADLAECAAAARELFDRPCSTHCAGRHLAVWTDAASIHVRSLDAPPPELSLEARLAALYPRRNGRNGRNVIDHAPELWPALPQWNTPLLPTGPDRDT